MTDKTYPYDPDLPYVVVFDGRMIARTVNPDDAERLGIVEVIDTTPKPRVPEDAS